MKEGGYGLRWIKKFTAGFGLSQRNRTAAENRDFFYIINLITGEHQNEL